MAFRLIVSVSKKVPGPQEYSSTQASCSIEVELITGQDAAAESARLYEQAESAVDHQLRLSSTSPSAKPSGVAPPPIISSSQPSQAPRSAPFSSGRRAPIPISSAQLRFLKQLLERIPGSLERLLADNGVTSIEMLSSRAASASIDALQAASR